MKQCKYSLISNGIELGNIHFKKKIETVNGEKG